MIVYENKMFVVEADVDNNKYVVINRQTGIEEFETTMLIEAMMSAKQFMELIDNIKKEERQIAGNKVVTLQ